ncbi:MAG: hypothetical protein ABEL76_13650 [Bradymonadaceae bacterium]
MRENAADLALVGLVLLFAAGGCSNRSAPGDWPLNGDVGPRGPDVRSDAPPSTQPDFDTGGEVGPDADGPDGSSGPEPVDARGLYMYGGETGDMFYVDFATNADRQPGPGACRSPTRSSTHAARWTADAFDKSELIRSPQKNAKRDAHLAIADLSGRLHAPSSDGHRKPDGRLEVDSTQIDACATYRTFGGCLEPDEGQRCLAGKSMSEFPYGGIEPEIKIRNEVRLGPESERSRRYVIEFDFGWDEIADGGARAKLVLRAPLDPAEGFNRWDLSNRVEQFRARFGNIAGPYECVYDVDAVQGWARRTNEGEHGRSLEIHVVAQKLEASGHPPAEDSKPAPDYCPSRPTTIWGQFHVDSRTGPSR